MNITTHCPKCKNQLLVSQQNDNLSLVKTDLVGCMLE